MGRDGASRQLSLISDARGDVRDGTRSPLFDVY